MLLTSFVGSHCRSEYTSSNTEMLKYPDFLLCLCMTKQSKERQKKEAEAVRNCFSLQNVYPCYNIIYCQIVSSNSNIHLSNK